MSTPMTVMLPPDLGQVAFVLQGSGALGADQVAVDQALHEAGVEPDWAERRERYIRIQWNSL